jgi:serine/threonine-protein kinase
VFGGRYVVQTQVGTGGMATVYRGDDSVLDRPVAIKVMLPQYAGDPAFAQRFKQEAQAAAALQNPYIVQVYDWGRDAGTGTYYIVMEYLRGTDLKTGIRSHGALAPRKVAQIGAQVCSALAVAHAHDIIHRDIKPQNIMIQPNGDAKVMDFGIARAKNSHLTQTNSVLGTAHYVSPEQAQGKELGPTSDLYSLGVVMYEAACGKLPFDGDDAVSVALKQVNEQPVPPSQVNPNVDDRLEAIILRCMDKDPARRFRSADELRGVLNDYITGRPVVLPAYAGGTTTQLPAGGTTQVIHGRSMGTVGGAGQTAGTMRMPVAGGAAGYAGGNGAGGRSGAGGRGTGNGRGGSQGRGGSGVAAIVGGVVAVLAVGALVALALSLTVCSGGSASNNPTIDDTQQGTDDASTAANLVEVPELVTSTGLTRQQATTLLESYGLKVGGVTEETSDVTAGKVIGQSLAAGSQVAKGTAVDIVLSKGPETVSFPTNLLGSTQADAEATLTAAGLVAQYDSSLDAYSDQYDEGTVVAYAPLNQSQVAKGTTVKYGLSKGVDPATLKTNVPYGLTGVDQATAEALIYAAELNPYVQTVYSDTVPEGVVAYISDTEGREIDKGDWVNLYVSKGPEPASVPYVTDGTWSSGAAESAMSNAGLYSSVVTGQDAPSSDLEGKVYATDPAGGSSTNPGTTVTIYVYGSAVSSDDGEPAAASEE